MKRSEERWPSGARKPQLERVCTRCDTEFISSFRQKYCSVKCRRQVRPTILDRFWERVTVAGPDDCWVWTGELNNQGYARFVLEHHPRRVRVLCHRFSYELATGTDTRGWVVLHACDNPPCVNPAHLSLGTQADNVADMRAKGRMNLSGLELGAPYRYGRAS